MTTTEMSTERLKEKKKNCAANQIERGFNRHNFSDAVCRSSSEHTHDVLQMHIGVLGAQRVNERKTQR